MIGVASFLWQSSLTPNIRSVGPLQEARRHQQSVNTPQQAGSTGNMHAFPNGKVTYLQPTCQVNRHGRHDECLPMHATDVAAACSLPTISTHAFNVDGEARATTPADLAAFSEDGLRSFTVTVLYVLSRTTL